jgi:hypothetical protein
MRKWDGRKREESNQEAKRHTQGADPATQADTEHSRGGNKRAGAELIETEKSSNQIQQNPEQTRPLRPPADTLTQPCAAGVEDVAQRAGHVGGMIPLPLSAHMNHIECGMHF